MQDRSLAQADSSSSRDSGQCGMAYARHTFGTLMKANGEDIKTIQELLRHSNYKVTADTYTQAVTPMKRAAQTKLVKMILLPTKKVGEERASSEWFFLIEPFQTLGERLDSNKSFRLLASPTGFEPVLPR